MTYILWFVVTTVIVTMWHRINKKLYGDALSPFNCLLVGWIGPLLLKNLHLSHFEKPWSIEVIALIAWVTVALILTSLVPALGAARASLASRRLVFINMLQLFQKPRFRALALICFIVGLGGYIYNEFYTNEIGIPLVAYVQNPDLTRADVPYWQWGKGNRLGLLSVPLFVVVPMLYMIGRTAPRRKEQFLYLTLSAIYPLGTLLKMSRIDLANILTSIIFVEYYYRAFSDARRRTLKQALVKYWRYLVTIAVIVITLILTATVFTGIRSGQNMASEQITAALGIDLSLPEPFYSVVVLIYGYIALPFENFANFYNSYKGGFHPGIGFFRPFLSLLAQGRVADDMLKYVEFNLQILPVNTYPFITLIHAELGVIGVVVSPVIYGLFINSLYARFRRRPNFCNTFVYIICPFAWLWMFSWPVFTVLTFYLYMAFTLVLYWLYEIIKPARGLRAESPLYFHLEES